MRADRLLRILVLLQRHRRLTAGDLAARLEVSERTVLRDMEALSSAGVPVFTERGRHGGCVLLDGFTTDASGLTASEAQALFAWSSREGAAELGLGSELTGALAKVAASASETAVTEAESLGAVLLSDRRRWFGEAERVPVLPQLREAAVAGRRVRIAYQRPDANAPSGRTVDPRGLVDQSGRWYLVAAHRGRMRTYRVSRIVDVTVLDEPVAPGDGRPLAQVWAELRSGFEARVRDPVTIDIEVGDEVRAMFFLVARSQLATETEPAPVGDPGERRWRLVVRARKPALALVLAWAPDVVLLAPDDLLEEVRSTTATLSRLYARSRPGAPEPSAVQ